MGMHPQIIELLDSLKDAGLRRIEDMTPADARTQMLAMVQARGVVVAEEVGEVVNRTIPGPAVDIPVRIYRPGTSDGGAPPVLVYFHGGGHVIGSPDTHDHVARVLCNGAGCVVVSVDYRKGPEHKFPAAAEDALAATRWVHGSAGELGADAARIAVGGDSAGGNLATVTALMARDAGDPPLVFQLLVYPVVDYGASGGSYDTYAKGYGALTVDAMRWFVRHYMNDPGEVDDWRASPLKASSHAGLPPALVITAECDVLHDEGAAYAARLEEAGVDVTHTDYPGMIHTFFGMPPSIDGASAAQAEACAALRKAFAQ